MAALDIHVGQITERITVRVRGLRGFGLRLWIARKLFLLGARVARVGIIMEPGEPIERHET
jgi:hypothetical protein